MISSSLRPLWFFIKLLTLPFAQMDSVIASKSFPSQNNPAREFQLMNPGVVMPHPVSGEI
jgi:hypothetical protein